MIEWNPKLEIGGNIRFFMTIQNQKKRNISSKILNSRSFINLIHSWRDCHPAVLYPGFANSQYEPSSFILPIDLAATHNWSISGAAGFLRDCKKMCPSSELILKRLRDIPPTLMEKYINHYLASYYRSLPKDLRQKVEKKGILIIDFHQDCYYGKEGTPYTRKSRVKKSTNLFYEYLTADIHFDSFNFTIAMIPRRPRAKIDELFDELYKYIERILKPKLILMDGEFPTVRVLRKLIELDIQCVARKIMTPRVKKALAQYKDIKPENWNRKWHSVDLRDTWIRRMTVTINVTPQFVKGTFKALMKTPAFEITPEQANKLYKKRFNIETGYRDKHLFQPRTCSVSLSIRLFFFLVAIFFWNLWQISRYLDRNAFSPGRELYKFSYMRLRVFKLIILLNIFT